MNIVIVGCGSVSEKYILGLNKAENIRISGFYDVSVERARKQATNTNSQIYLREGDFLNDPNIDLVVNLTPPEQHFEVNRKILLAGKHAFSEKPMALTAHEAFQLQEIAEEKGLFMLSAPDTFLAQPFQTAKNLYDAGMIGAATSFSAAMVGPGHEAWHPQPEYYYKKGAGPLWDMGPYFLTQLVNILGPVSHVSAMGGTPRHVRQYSSPDGMAREIHVEVPTHYDVILQTMNNVTGTFTVSYDIISDRRPYFDLYGTKGVLQLENPDEYRGSIKLINQTSTEIFDCPETSMPARARAFGIVDLYNRMSAGQQPRISGQLAAHVISVMEAIETSLSQKRQITLSP